MYLFKRDELQISEVAFARDIGAEPAGTKPRLYQV